MENTLAALSDELAAAVEAAGQSVVAVHGRPRIPSSGLHWKPGIIVTAEHTLRRREDIRVTLANGESLAAEIAGRDPGTDLAVLKIDSQDAAAPRIRSGDLKPGNIVLAAGRSPETGVNAALGVIGSFSGAWHTWRGGKIDHFIRLDVALYPGSSGGAVVDTKGDLVGLATDGLSRLSVLAVPAVTIDRVVGQLLEKGHISRGFLGIGLQPVALPEHLYKHLPEKAGLIVLSVEPDGPAAQAGICIGDVLLQLEGKPVGDTSDVQSALGPESVGKAIPVALLRAGALTEAFITVGERPTRRA